ncbi:hypothetical protein LF1_27130 [Rubripirellula obstinata]|uniref:Uncharacterized protein n=1 Tax=Rubripirellula obstinata TaxID=406547 RepID=A0A5B1CLG7_9BACT|nr:hypothetical protein [Rubripirellula obstinata]KAA1260174.1 hypothetical protein LF1_27130 [Rubripirellula obstinata]
MHSQSQRWTTISALIAAAFIVSGCRGTKPFGRFAKVTPKVTQETDGDLLNVDPPQQRLATSRPRPSSEIGGAPSKTSLGGTEITMTAEPVEAGPRQNTSPNSRTVAANRPPSTKTRNTSVSKRRTLQQDIVRRDPVSRENLSRDSSRTAKTARPSPQVERLASQRTKVQDDAVDPQHSDLLDAFADYPPEVQREALRRLVAATSKSAKKTEQPSGFDSELQKQARNLPKLPPAKNAAADVPATRLGTPQESKPRRSSSVVTVADQSRPHQKKQADEPAVEKLAAKQQPSGRDLLVQQQKAAQQKIAAMTNRVSNLATGVQEPSRANDYDLQADDSSDLATSTPPIVTSVGDLASDPNENSVQPASASRPSGMADDMIARAAPESGVSASPSGATPSHTISPDANSLSDEQLYQALVKQLSTAPQGESESQRSSRLIKLRHLMVLSGDVDSAVKKIEGMSESEQEFLRHQLLGLWTMVDPSGHPVASRRITTALPQLRQATQFAAAATDSLEVRSVSFCSEIESYGQIKPFKSNRFDAGQQVILYCEIENFSAERTGDEYVTEMQGSYDIFDANNQKVVSQLLPADRQVSSNYLRDYYIAYQMHLPKQLPAGKYRLQLTMEDVGGKKYGQSSIDLQISN